jgi:PKD repeat protein
MKSHEKKRARVVRAVPVGLLAAASVLGLLPSPEAWAGQRQFLVTLADSPKDGRRPCAVDGDCQNLGTGTVCGDAGIGRTVCVVRCTTDANCAGVPQPDRACHPSLHICDDHLPSPELIRRQYFDKTDPNIGSFAEYWKEISYGDVTVAGRVTDWILLPWPISVPFTFVDLDGSSTYHYGTGEDFTNQVTMVGVNIGGPITDPNYDRGGKQTTANGTPVWTPGERFIDMNGNGVWDGFDEAANSMDWGRPGTPTGAPFDYSSPDGRPDNPGPWIDLNGDGIPDNPPNCIYLPDSDNDGNPDCCPNGPGKPGCEGGKPESCPATSVPGPNGNILDCNGNGIPDECDISCTAQACIATGWTGACGASKDRLPVSGQGSSCTAPTADGIPDECQYNAPDTDCVATVPTNCGPDNRDPCCGKSACSALTGNAVRTTVPRCEYADVNGNGRLDIVEPFENFLHGVPFSRPDPFPPPDDPLWVPGSDYDTYVRNNYPGSNPNALIARKTVRLIGGPHDPRNRITDARHRLCADGQPYRTIGSQSSVCPAGVHAEYNPPDKWVDQNSSKMVIGGSGTTTPKPDWYEQAWRDRYNNATPPPWDSSVSALHVDRDLLDPAISTLFDPFNPFGLNTFRPNRGGLRGDGDRTNWIGDLPDQTPVLPDQLNGVGTPVILYDGPVEHDDLPSSKYHMNGDQYLGEVTSPFSYSIAGDDRGTNDPLHFTTPDGIIPAAGPYATRLHGQNGRDGGNQLNIEVLTWRNTPPANDAVVWTSRYGSHPYAKAARFGGTAPLGFCDYNLDGWLDLGEVRTPGAESYMGIFGNDVRSPRGNAQARVLEDCVQVLDETFDFDSYVDPVVLDAVACYNPGIVSAQPPPPYTNDGPVTVAGILSGIVLIPPFHTPFSLFIQDIFTGFFLPVHNEDGLGDAAFQASTFPDPPGTPQINWNIRFHSLIHVLGTGFTPESLDFATTYAAEIYALAWQHWPDTEDYDQYDHSGVVNCPIGKWDIMSIDHGLVHPIPPHKEAACTEWINTVDLTSVLTPGVDKSITFPTGEFVRDDSYYFLENEDRPTEKLYFWSAGSGFDENMPGGGLLILHADPTGSNNDAIVLQQRSGLRPAYLIIQADGLHELEAGPGLDLACGDAGDPFPGATNQTTFDCSTLPASQWYTDDACTGLEILDILPDGSGATRVTFNWTPTSIPSLKFVDPPGGVTVGTTYQIRTEANDVYGGTSIRFYYKKQDVGAPDFSGSTFISPQVRKTTSGPNDISIDWNISGVPDGRYFIFADLIPGQGADGTEAKLTRPRPGRNNQGTAKLDTSDVNVNVTTVSGTTVTQGTARSEAWTIRCVDATVGKWVVGSSLTQPLPPGEPSTATCTSNPTLCATTETAYTSLARAVTFTIGPGTGASPNGAVGDTFTFTTTGITAPSAGVTIRNGQIREDPTAIIDASPLSGPPPLTVNFDARRSIDPNGQPLQFRWDFGGGVTATGAQTSRMYANAGDFTVTLRATNPANSRFGEASVDISVTNNSPKAVIKATPTSGQGPLDVHFSATQSSDAETAADQLIYQWDYGDGVTANDQGTPGILREPVHTYARRADGTLCTTTNPCMFTATLKVTDGGGKSDTDSTVIRVGNTNPVASVSTTALQGSSPLTVTFNAKNSTDPENDPLEVEWQWGDGTPNEKYPAKTGKPPATDGSVPHTFTLPANTASKTFAVKATVYDLKADGTRKGGETIWPGVSVTVTAAASGDSDPRAIFCFQVGNECETTTPTLAVDQSFTVDASRSFDNPAGGRISAYTWDWGDGTPFASGVTQTHKYSAAGTYTITLTVADGDSPPHTGRTQKSVVVTQEGGEPPPPSTNHPPSAIFVISPPEAFVGEVVNFDARSSSDPDGDALRYRWVFGDGNQTQFTTNPRTTHTYASPGSYLVRLTVRDAANASTDATQTVRVLLQGENRSPVPMIATGPRAGTAPLTLTFDGRISYDPDGDAITYTWEFRQNGELTDTMTGSVVTRVFETPGDYTVQLVVKDGAGAEGRSEPQSILVTESSAPPPPEPPPPRPEPQEPPDSSGQRPKPTAMCGLGMLPGLLASLAGLTLTAMTRRRLKG